jgi:fumarate reductase subunit D
MISRLSPYLWLAFSAGGTVAAFLLPAHVVLFALVLPLGWIDGGSHASLHGVVSHPIVRLYLFVLISLPLFHWAHRFRYALYDGLQLKHLEILIATLCYGGAVAGTVVAAWTLWTIAPAA